MQSLFKSAKDCFLTADPELKVEQTFELTSNWQSGNLSWDKDESIELCDQPGRLDKPKIVLPKDLGRRKIGSEEGRAALIHALAHIELTAVNLAWDAIYRYRDMPKAFYDDWAQCAKEEATHFTMLQTRLREMGYDYGSFPAHNELWKMAIETKEDVSDRMAVVHRVFEARALDVVPGTIKRFDNLGDQFMVKTLNLICDEEVGHVSSAARWFRYRCDREEKNSDEEFFRLLKKYMRAPPKGPFDRVVRLQAGFSSDELDFLEKNSAFKNWE
ncbi:MAG: ferritin-like domain-containing protein [Kangiellaceae bacterium]